MEENTSKIYVGSSGVNPMIAATGAGTPLFVINLCASIAPVQTSGKNLPGLDNYRLYQVSRVEDGRTRHRLRLGFFTSESHAERVLTVVRQQYPTAFTSCLGDEDRKFARGFLPDTAIAAPMPSPAKPVSVVPPPAKPAAAKQTPAPVAAKAAAAPAVAAKPAAAPAPAAKALTKPAAPKAPVSAEAEIIEVTWEPEPAATAKPAAATAASAPTQPALPPDAGLDEFTWEPPALEPKVAGRNPSDTSRHPVLAPVYKTQDVTKAPTAAKSAADTSASMRVPVLKLSSSNSMRVPALKSDTSTTTRVPALKVDIASSAKVATLKPDTAASMKVPALKTDTSASMKVPALKLDASSSMKVPALKPDNAASTRVPALKADTSASMRVPALSLSDPPPAPAAKSPPQAPAKPFHVGKGVDITDVGISLESDLPTVSPAQKPAAKVAAKASAPAVKAAPVVKAPLAAKAPAAQPVHTPVTAAAAPKVPAGIAAQLGALPDLDSTQTIRALTNDELNDGSQEKWFAIQLAASEQPVNLDAMPRLDIFEAYRLYSVASAGSGRIVHSLRLGFFKEAVSAEAVGGYLKTFFGSPSVMRVSVAEHARFKDAPAPKPAPPKAEAKVLDFNQTRGTRPVIPTVTMEVSTASADTSATGSFKTSASGSFKVGASGKHKALAPPKGGPTPKRSNGQRARTGTTGKHKALQPKSLSQELLEEAREVELSASGIRKLPKNDSLLSRLVDKLKK